MKNIMKLLPGLFFTAALLYSCKKDEHKDYFGGGVAPVLVASKTASIPLSFANKDEEAVKLTWTNPGYSFTTGISSQDVSYLLEIDTTGSNFTSPKRQSIAISKQLSVSFNVSVLNDYLLNQLVLVPGTSHNIEMRVKSALTNNSVPLFSNILKFTVIPYAIPPKVEPPANGTLWLTGDATTSGYSNPLPAPYDVNQKFTMVTSTLYQLTVSMTGGGAYKLIQEQGKWDTQYHMLTGGSWDGGDFEKKDANPGFTGPPAAGNYKITIDFQRGKFSVTKL